ncbi:hypothetical protein VCRA2119O147_350009 [Vibrio crassostreae]|nr:hypothetical protein EDB47_1189 [Vibrio crassostreae]CAK2343790.1 hypothetical protein VCRA2119O147_350009 [Vibrio crassostreae]CAK2900578.1 hypothetical protein VCRA2121O264_320009 [Vibrio crassostreae]CAK3572585.1 hypothetical protein VCRA2121O262_330037 [Vibrio crassostreae]
MRTLYFIVGYTLLQFGIVTFLTNPLVSSSLTIINFLAVGGGLLSYRSIHQRSTSKACKFR